VRLVESERDRREHDSALWTEIITWHNANAVGEVLRYVAEYQGQWVAVLTFCLARVASQGTGSWLEWSPRQVSERRHLIGQNNRFLVLPSTGRWPNLRLRVLRLVCDRVRLDWQRHFGTPVFCGDLRGPGPLSGTVTKRPFGRR